MDEREERVVCVEAFETVLRDPYAKTAKTVACVTSCLLKEEGTNEWVTSPE